MNEPLTIRHVVSLAGIVHEPLAPENADAPDKESKKPEPKRVSGALVEILVNEAPRAFQSLFEARKADPAWQREDKRIDRTHSRRDGAFFFADLPPGEPGETYRLRVSTPQMGTRYGTVETAPVTVQQNPAGSTVQVAWVDVELPVTEIRGTVVDSNDAAVVRARVHLFGDNHFVRTEENGHFRLARLLAGDSTLEVLADKFETFRQKVGLRPGQVLDIDVRLQPKSNGS